MQEIAYASKAVANINKPDNENKQKGISMMLISWMGTRNSQLTKEM